MDKQEYEEISRELARDYFLIKKSAAWLAIGGAITAFLTIFGITLYSIRTTIASNVQVQVMQGIIEEGKKLKEQATVDASIIINKREEMDELLKETPKLPERVAKLEDEFQRINRIAKVKNELNDLNIKCAEMESILEEDKKVPRIGSNLLKKDYDTKKKRISDLSNELIKLEKP